VILGTARRAAVATSGWMINFRVDDLDAMVAQVRSAGETVDLDPERYPNGRFAELRDPEGNGVQLRQPMGHPWRVGR
jgi:glyoxylase I family protein